jgi:hypothetical protein
VSGVYVCMSNTADITGSKPIAVSSQSISVVTAINHIVAFYAIHGRNREVQFFYFVLDTTLGRDHERSIFRYNLLCQSRLYNTGLKSVLKKESGAILLFCPGHHSRLRPREKYI